MILHEVIPETLYKLYPHERKDLDIPRKYKRYIKHANLISQIFISHSNIDTINIINITLDNSCT